MSQPLDVKIIFSDKKTLGQRLAMFNQNKIKADTIQQTPYEC